MVENHFHFLFTFIRIKSSVSAVKMVFLSKAQQRNKNIETVIDNLWDLNKHGVKFKFEVEFEYGKLDLDNTKMSRMREKNGLAAAVFKDYIEVAKLPNPLSKLTQIDAFNWLQTQVRLDQKIVMKSIQKDRVAFGEEESKPSFWKDEVLPWTCVKKTFKNLNPEHPGLISKVKTMIAIRLNSLGKDPESYVTTGDKEVDGEPIVAAEGVESSHNVEFVDVVVVEKETSIEGVGEKTLESSRATGAVINSPGVSPRAPSEVHNQGSVSTEEEDTVEDDIASKSSSSDEGNDSNNTLQLANHKRQLEQKLKTAMLFLSTSSSGSGTITRENSPATRENSPAKEKNKEINEGKSLNKKCDDCKFKAKNKTLLDQHIRAKHPFNLIGGAMSDSEDEMSTAPRKSTRKRKTTQCDSHIYDTDWEQDWLF